jgi:Gas vesicle protein
VSRRQRPRHTTVPAAHPPRGVRRPAPPKTSIRPRRPPPRAVARIVDEGDASLLDVIDNLLNKGVVLNADVILALANVDLVYIRLSALVCAADRLIPKGRAR